MNEPEPDSGGGWTVGRVLGLIVGILGMAGFGVCGVCGLLLGTTSSMGFAALCGVVGLLIAAAFALLVRAMTRRAQGKPPNTP